MAEDHKPLPVAGYTPQSGDKVALVNHFKEVEERLLRELDVLQAELTNVVNLGDQQIMLTKSAGQRYDGRWIAIARTHFQEGFMALNRSVFQPQRIALPEDEAEG